MITKELVGKLKDFNLNMYESKIWLALLMKGSATAGKLSEITDVPRSRCYDVLESLEKKGFIVMKLGRPIKYMAVAPEEAIDRTKQKLMDDAKERINIVENIRNTKVMQELQDMHKTSMTDVRPEDLTGIIKSDKNIRDHFSYMLKNAEYLLLSIDSEELQNKASIILQHKSPSSIIKIITDAKTKDKKIMEKLSAVADIKEVNIVKRFAISDKNAAIFLTENEKSDDSMVWINSNYSINLLKDLFDAKWASI